MHSLLEFLLYALMIVLPVAAAQRAMGEDR